MNPFPVEIKTRILQQLQDRNKKEKGFTELFKHHERLFENWAAVRSENIRLSMQVERGGDGGRVGGDRNSAEDREKILSLQEELTQLHRKRGENASQVLSLSAKLTEKEGELATCHTEMAEMVAKNADLEEKVKFLEEHIKELEATNELLRDEHTANHLDYTQIQNRFRKLEVEHNQLIQRFIELQNQRADVMNQEIKRFTDKKRAEVQKELQEAAELNVEPVVDCGPSLLPLAPHNIAQMAALSVFCTIPRNATHKFEAHESEVNAVRWSPNGINFATGGTDRKVKIWECGNTAVEQKGVLIGSNGGVLSIDFDAAGDYILASSTDFACRVWTVADHRLRHTLTGHSGKVSAARFMGSQSRVISGSQDRTLKIWDLRSISCISTKFAGSSCFDVVTVGDGSTSVISGHFDKRIRFWDVRTDSTTQEITLQGKITSLDLSLDQNSLLASVRDDSIEVLDLRMNSVSGTYTADGFKLSSDFSRACFSPDGQFIACGSADGSVYVWNVLDKKVEAVLRDHTSAVGAVHWQLQKGIALLSADRSKKVVVWMP